MIPHCLLFVSLAGKSEAGPARGAGGVAAVSVIVDTVTAIGTETGTEIGTGIGELLPRFRGDSSAGLQDRDCAAVRFRSLAFPTPVIKMGTEMCLIS